MKTAFSFLVEIDAKSEDNERYPLKRTFSDGNGITINLIGRRNKNDSAFMEIFGFRSDTILSYDKDGNQLDIDWDDRDDPEILKKISNRSKYVIQLGEERHEYASRFDLAKFVEKHIDEIKGKVVLVTGDVEKDVYEGKSRDRFRIRNLYDKSGDEEAKKKMRVVATFFWTREGIDTADWKKEKKILVNGYTYDYYKAKGQKKGSRYYFPATITVDLSGKDLDDEKTLSQVNIDLEELGLALEDGKLSCSLKKGKVYANEFRLRYINGNEEVEFGMDQLTEKQKRRVLAGMNKVEDFKPAGTAFGDRITIYKFIEPTYKGEYTDGIKILKEGDDDVKLSDFEDEIYEFVSVDDDDDLPFDNKDKKQEEDEKPKKSSSKAKKKQEPEEDDDDDDDDLFGDDEDEDDEEEAKPKKNASNTKSKAKKSPEPKEDDDDDDDIFDDDEE